MVKPRRPRDDLGEFLSNAGLTSFVVYQLQLFNQAAAIIGRGFHRHHTGGLLAGRVFNHALINLRFDVAAQEGIQQRFRIGLIQVIGIYVSDQHLLMPVTAAAGDRRNLRHGVNKFVADNVQLVQTAFIIGLQHHFYRADQFGQGWVIPIPVTCATTLPPTELKKETPLEPIIARSH